MNAAVRARDSHPKAASVRFLISTAWPNQNWRQKKTALGTHKKGQNRYKTETRASGLILL